MTTTNPQDEAKLKSIKSRIFSLTQELNTLDQEPYAPNLDAATLRIEQGRRITARANILRSIEGLKAEAAEIEGPPAIEATPETLHYIRERFGKDSTGAPVPLKGKTII